jgi:hypothetical protein
MSIGINSFTYVVHVTAVAAVTAAATAAATTAVTAAAAAAAAVSMVGTLHLTSLTYSLSTVTSTADRNICTHSHVLFHLVVHHHTTPQSRQRLI